MNELLSVSEARKLTGKSESTIKRMIHEITADENHEDRGLIEPSHEELERRKAEKEPYVWKIHKSLLEKRYPVHAPSPNSGQDGSSGVGDSSKNDLVHSQLIELLQSQIKTLETQLDRKDEQIANANQRTEEIHVLMQTLQKHMGLKAPNNLDPNVVTANPSEGIQKKGSSLREILNRPIRIFRKQ
jgi:hypothetical protein